DEELMKQFTDERDVLESQIDMLQFCQRMDDLPLYSRRPSCDTLALAMCDPGLRRRHSSECEEDSLPEVYVDSGLSTLRGSHAGYDSEPEVKGQDEEEGAQRVKKKLRSGNGESDAEKEDTDSSADLGYMT
ncbi:unnamed protein product, partial [Tetraodon nigroviridis]